MIVPIDCGSRGNPGSATYSVVVSTAGGTGLANEAMDAASKHKKPPAD